MRIAICDDEPIYIASLSEKINLWAKAHNRLAYISVSKYTSTEDLLEDYIHSQNFDLFFLDIRVPNEMSGMSLAREIYMHNDLTPIVFITNYAEYVYEGYTVNALRYIRKPFSEKDIFECLDIVWKQWELCSKEYIVIETSSKTIRLSLSSIIYIEVMHHELIIHSASVAQNISFRLPLEKLLAQLPAESFPRCHRSYAVNLKYVRSFGNAAITMSDGSLIPIGRNFSNAFVSAFRTYYRGSVIK